MYAQGHCYHRMDPFSIALVLAPFRPEPPKSSNNHNLLKFHHDPPSLHPMDELWFFLVYHDNGYIVLLLRFYV